MNDHIQKMHQARRDARDASVWESVSASIERNHCKCGLRKGMAQEELLLLGAGCTNPNYVCPALDTYRRLLPAIPIPEEQRALEEAV